MHGIVDWNGTLNAGDSEDRHRRKDERRFVPRQYIKALQHLSDTRNVIWHLVSFISINDRENRWAEIQNATRLIEGDHGLVWHHSEQVYKPTGRPFILQNTECVCTVKIFTRTNTNASLSLMTSRPS